MNAKVWRTLEFIFSLRTSEHSDDSGLSSTAAIKRLIQHSQGLCSSGAACSVPRRSPEAMIHAEGSTVGSVIHQQVSRWAERCSPLTDGSTIKISSSKGGRRRSASPTPRRQHRLDLLSRRGNATMYNLLTQRQSRV